MRALHHSLFLIFILLGAAACSPQSQGGTYIGKIYLDPQFSPEQVQTIEEDLEFLRNIPSVETSAELRQILNVHHSSGEDLYSWIESRIRYLFPESITVQKKLFISSKNYSYANPNSFPTLDSGTETEQNNAEAGVVLASNLGSSFYLKGKLDRILISFSLDESNSILITSPRIGIVQLRTSYFSSTLPSGETLDPISEKLFRLSILFHEARHSDGNGKSMGFFHNICPTHHRYAGHDACDLNGNGPYTVSGLFLKHLIEIYKAQLSITSYHLLLNMADDFLLRRITHANSTQIRSVSHSHADYWDDTPEAS